MRVCVFCGSQAGRGGTYLAAAQDLSRALAEQQLGLVYGGASVGTMGALADAMLAAGGEAIGVIPQGLMDREIAHPDLTELRVVPGLHERKAEMADLADLFIALPGGAGTMEELFEVLTWRYLGLHDKPIGLLDVEGYFKPLLAFLDHMVAQEFLTLKRRSALIVEEDPRRLVARLTAQLAQAPVKVSGSGPTR